MIRRIGVVIPARDEEALVGACLRSVLDAAANVAVAVEIVVVADGCVDATASIAASFPGVTVIELDASNVGSARAAGAELMLDRGAEWISNTDADSRVPANWLSSQSRLADAGHDVVLGTVRPDFDDLRPEEVVAWRALHDAGSVRRIYGANLGVRASAYRAAGGYRDLAEHEDVDLVDRLGSADIVIDSSAEVVTSARKLGRTPGGFARFLREELEPLALETPDVEACQATGNERSVGV